MSEGRDLVAIDEVLAGTWDKLRVPLPQHFTVAVVNCRISRIGRKLLGLPLEPRPSRGFRRHIRRMKRNRSSHA